MYELDYDDFAKELTDLCLSVNRPCNNDLVRVFWEDLKAVPMPVIRERCRVLRAEGKTRFTSHDLRSPPTPDPVACTFEPFTGAVSDDFYRIGALTLMRFLWDNGDISEELRAQMVARQRKIVESARQTPEFNGMNFAELRTEMAPMLNSAFRRLLEQSRSQVAA